ncbi:MAG: hypothetical protein EOM25_13795 [Deltaproteobacteria bacterium]|nr:hypothetical protein [Deltaproteobacteria bacterium]
MFELQDSIRKILSGDLSEKDLNAHLDFWHNHFEGMKSMPDFWASDLGAAMAEFEARVHGHVDPLRQAVQAGNQHILGTESGLALLAEHIGKPEQGREIQKRSTSIDRAHIFQVIKALRVLKGMPLADAVEHIANVYAVSPETIEQHILKKRTRR